MITTDTENNMDKKQSDRVDGMEDILRGEMSAVEAYQQVMKKIDDNPEAIRLQEFLTDHQQAVSHWKKQVLIEQVSPEESSGVWGNFVKAFVGSAKLFGDTATLKALKEGEEHGLRQYEDFLKDDNASMIDKEYVRDVLIPNQKRHINSIDAMMKMQ